MEGKYVVTEAGGVRNHCAWASCVRTQIFVSIWAYITKSPPETYLINKFHCFFPLYTTNRTNLLIIKEDAIEFVRGDKHLRSERCRDELTG